MVVLGNWQKGLVTRDVLYVSSTISAFKVLLDDGRLVQSELENGG